jgi:chemotaxis protein methyltransferase CheR
MALEHIGISLSDAKQALVYGRLARRLRQLGLDSFDQYCELLQRDGGGELKQFTNAITTNLTAFFREPHHFDYLAATVVPELKRNKAAAKRLRIWSAGCSSGEEPYSIAMVLAEAIPRLDLWDAQILATDIDCDVLAKGESGIYAENRIAGLSPIRKKRWFLKGGAGSAGNVRVVPELRRLIRFQKLNLVDNWPMRGPFDFIFCRNVVIYFDKTTQKALFDRFARLLTHGSPLFIGHSESLFKVSDCFELIGKSTYSKCDVA